MQKHYVDHSAPGWKRSRIGGNIAALLVGSLGNFMVPASENSVITQKRWMR